MNKPEENSGDGNKHQKPTKKKLSKWILWPVFILGLLIFSYPFFSQAYYRKVSKQEVNTFNDSVKSLESVEVDKRIELAKAYNKTLDPSRIMDPYSAEEEAGRAEYARMLELKEKIGYVTIPKLDLMIPTYAGTSEFVLQKGAGHLEGTSLPVGGKDTHSVITAHRGLPSAELFTHLDKLEKGDIFYFTNIQTTLAYRVDQILVVEPSNFEPVLVVDGEDYMTLLTCTPYMINSHRLLVRGTRIEYTPPAQENLLPDNRASRLYMYLALGMGLLVLILILLVYKNNRKIKKIRKGLDD
ncbi:MAG: class C sortase [Clostridiaceae bacterium]